MLLEYEIKSVVRTFQVLKALSEDSLSPSELSKKLNMNKSTLHRFLSTLKGLGYIEIGQNNAVRLSQSFINLGIRAQKHYQIHATSRPYLEQLAKNFKESALLAIFNGREVQYVDNIESSHAVRTVFDPGKKTPAYAVASGKLFLSTLDEKNLYEYLQAQELIAFTSNTLTDNKSLKNDLERIKDVGYAVDNEEYEIGLKGFACPIKDSTGNVIAALCIAGIASRITDKQKINNIIKSLLSSSENISLKMGFQEMTN